jgi:cell division septation protein DedD
MMKFGIKKNRKKEPEFKKPFIVLTRRKIAGWLFIIFFLCAWMFILGVLVGRGTAPVKFDIAAIEKKLAGSTKTDSDAQPEMPAQKDELEVKDKTKLDFYEALKENREDPKTPELQQPKVDDRKVEETPEGTVAQEPPPDKSAAQKAAPEESKTAVIAPNKEPKQEKTKVPAVAKTNTVGPTYTIQAASVRDPKDADRLVEKLKKAGYPAYRQIGKIPGKGVWFRVRVGEYKGKAEAMGVMEKLKKDGLKPILVMREM